MTAPLDPFALFCAYHLGFDVRTPERKPRHLNAHDVAARFGLDPAALDAGLAANGMSAARMLNLDFDLTGARMDLEASPPGVDLLSIAQMHWELFLSAAEKPRDWDRELAEDARENEKTFKKRER